MLRRSRFFWKLSLGNTLLIVTAFALFFWAFALQFRRFDEEARARYLLGHANAVRTFVENVYPDPTGLQALVTRLRVQDPKGPRVTVIRADGKVLADSDGEPHQMPSHLDRAEVIDALRVGTGKSTRYSTTVLREMSYAASRMGDAQNPIGVIRTALPIDAMTGTSRAFEVSLAALAATIAAGAAAITFILAAWWTARIRRMIAAAQMIARGELNFLVAEPGHDEITGLAKVLNRLRERFSRQVGLIQSQQATLQSLVECLQEGVLVIASDGRILLCNSAAAQMLGLNSNSPGLRIEQCVHQHDILALLNDSNLESRTGELREVHTAMESPQGRMTVLAKVHEIQLPPAEDGSPVDKQSARSARLLLLYDITAIERAVKTQTEFVANASHELRTPLAAIKAAVETLMQLDLQADVQAVPRFLQMISRHSARVEALLRDLLSLSKLDGAVTHPVDTISPRQLCNELHERWEQAIDEKGINWSCRISPETPAVKANAHLLNLALDNLLDNAIKFSEPQTSIILSVTPNFTGAEFTVIDEGMGIPPEHIPRVFERFYQVNPARPGDPRRGTGLGLAIVRHAAAAMGGNIEIQSEVGIGTRAILTVPAADAASIIRDH